jgi:hypothetical protein
MEDKIKNKAEMMSKMLMAKWAHMEPHLKAMNAYMRKGEFSDGYSGEQIFALMMESLTIITGEMINPLSRYKKYEPKDHTISEYVDMVIDTISEEMPSIKDKEKILPWIEEFRVDMWGYINYHSSRFIKIDAEKSEKIENKDSFLSALKECMVIVMLECGFRKVERSFK